MGDECSFPSDAGRRIDPIPNTYQVAFTRIDRKTMAGHNTVGVVDLTPSNGSLSCQVLAEVPMSLPEECSLLRHGSSHVISDFAWRPYPVNESHFVMECPARFREDDRSGYSI